MRSIPHPAVLITWEDHAGAVVAMLRLGASRAGDDPEMTTLVAELSDESEDFRRLWAAHDVREYSHRNSWTRSGGVIVIAHSPAGCGEPGRATLLSP
ncbi:MAG: hypothetical protein ABSA02_32765 [Trebonia sp.]